MNPEIMGIGVEVEAENIYRMEYLDDDQIDDQMNRIIDRRFTRSSA